MGHLPETAKLVKFKSGDPLFAADLDHNFALVHGWAETAMAEARRALAQERLEARRAEAAPAPPDPERDATLAAHGALIRQMSQLIQRVERLEREVAMLRGRGSRT